MGAGPTTDGILHLHPLDRCNLECRHCYSDSSPARGALLSLGEAMAAVRQAAAWGYTVLSVSGGEPLLYPDLRKLLEFGRDHGMRTAVVSNGLLIDRPGALDALRVADTVAISVDGLNESHNLLRGRPRAYSSVLHTLTRLAEADMPFLVNCGVCTHNLHELEALAEAVTACGAAGLQLHPVELAGRAATTMRGEVLAGDDMELFYVTTALLASEYAGRLPVHVDATHRLRVLQHPSLIYGHPLEHDLTSRRPADLLSVLVLTPSGELLPVCYGFPAAFRLGNIRNAPMVDLWPDFLTDGYLRLRALGRELVAALAAGSGPDVFNPNDLLAQSAARHRPLRHLTIGRKPQVAA